MRGIIDRSHIGFIKYISAPRGPILLIKGGDRYKQRLDYYRTAIIREEEADRLLFLFIFESQEQSQI